MEPPYFMTVHQKVKVRRLLSHFLLAERWRYVSNCSWPGPAALWRVFVQRFHSAQHGEGEGGAGRGFALPRPEELVRSGSAG
ncbi:unnamed protein product [Rangifer tarandus platyrhynchus]|uniref:Uncharacterized protein n=2 Tax=Rangifer tarandus platyrhynchus TaxID=3082113 RepID=A0AC59Z5X3_RANTA|nr:unnamed protein product [Rangifer tarandus platyrhynchus]